MPEVAKFLFTSYKTRPFVNLLPLSSSTSLANSVIRVSWRGGSVASVRLSKISIHLVGAHACSSSSSKRSCAANLGVSQCIEWKGSNFSNPLRVWFSEFLWISGVALSDSYWEKAGLRASSRASFCVSGDRFHYAAQISSFYLPLCIVCVNIKVGCSRPKHKLFLHNIYNHVRS